MSNLHFFCDALPSENEIHDLSSSEFRIMRLPHVTHFASLTTLASAEVSFQVSLMVNN